MKIAIYPGSFDPFTLGHLDIVERSAKIADELIVAVLRNSAKNPLFSIGESVSMIKELVSHLPNVRVDSFDGLTADYAKAQGATIIVRGLRAVTDFEYDLQIAQTNGVINPGIDTVFLTTNLSYMRTTSAPAMPPTFQSHFSDSSKLDLLGATDSLSVFPLFLEEDVFLPLKPWSLFLECSS